MSERPPPTPPHRRYLEGNCGPRINSISSAPIILTSKRSSISLDPPTSGVPPLSCLSLLPSLIPKSPQWLVLVPPDSGTLFRANTAYFLLGACSDISQGTESTMFHVPDPAHTLPPPYSLFRSSQKQVTVPFSTQTQAPSPLPGTHACVSAHVCAHVCFFTLPCEL